MIYKALTRNNPSFFSTLKYMCKGSNDIEVKNLITHNLCSDTIEGIVSEYLENESYRKCTPSNRIFLYHDILSISSKEDKTKISDTNLNEIALKYISLRGKNGIYAGAIHRDKEHIHIHFMVGGTEFKTGKAFRLSKLGMQKLKIDLQEYHKEKFPQITNSFPEHGKGREYITNKEWQLKHRDERKSVKEQIQNIVNECFENAMTQKEFIELLQQNRLHHYERNGIPTGIIHEEMKIRFSRLGISKEQFNGLPIDRTEEDKALLAISKLRKQTISMDKLKTHQNEM